MPTLNRFPLLGLWAKEAARRLGYRKDEAESLGHAYAVLYAIRARSRPTADKEKRAATHPKSKKREAKRLDFAGDELDVVYTPEGHVRGRVGGERPQTPASYGASVADKFPPGYYKRLERAFRQVLKTYQPSELDSRLAYDLHDQWKTVCAVGRSVNLDKLLTWCHQQDR
jgi:hypothetical protein